MKKVTLASIAMVFALTSFIACDKNKSGDEPNVVTFKVSGVTGNTEGITTVNAVYVKEVGFVGLGVAPKKEMNEADVSAKATTAVVPTVPTANFTKGGFAIDLPLTLSNVELITVKKSELKGIADMSIESFKMVQVQFEGCKKSVKAGVICNRNTDRSIESFLFYSENQLTIKGTSTAENGTEYLYDMTIAKGWNKYYIKSEIIAASGEGEKAVAKHNKYSVQTVPFKNTTIGWHFDAVK